MNLLYVAQVSLRDISHPAIFHCCNIIAILQQHCNIAAILQCCCNIAVMLQQCSVLYGMISTRNDGVILNIYENNLNVF